MARAVEQVGIGVIALCGFLTNGFICAAFMHYRKLRTVTNYFVVNLAVAGIISMTTLALWEVAPVVHVADMYLFTQSMDIFAGSLSAASVTAIAFDRFYAVSRPLRYASYVTHSKAVCVIVGVWVYALVIAVLTWFRKLDLTVDFEKVYGIALALCNVVVVLILCFFCYVSIFLYAWPHLKRDPALRHCAPASRGFALAKHLKITFTILLLSAPVLFGWSTFYAITAVEQFITTVPLGDVAEFVVSTLPQMIAALNPIIYILLTRDFREVAKTMLYCRDRQREERLSYLQFIPPSAASQQPQFTATYQRQEMMTVGIETSRNI